MRNYRRKLRPDYANGIFSVKCIYYLNGDTVIKENAVKKKSRNAVVPVVFTDNAIEVVTAMRNDGYEIVALEIADEATPIRLHSFKEKTCIIAGNEKSGIPPELLCAADKVCYIEMLGGNISSLNVSISAAIAVNKYAEQMIAKRD